MEAAARMEAEAAGTGAAVDIAEAVFGIEAVAAGTEAAGVRIVEAVAGIAAEEAHTAEAAVDIEAEGSQIEVDRIAADHIAAGAQTAEVAAG